MNKPKQATALSYSGVGAPTVTAKGSGIIAEDIIAMAKQANIHIHHNPHLSEFLQRLELGEEIPAELYTLIAEILSFVYLLEGKQPENWTQQGIDIET
ncbi:MAG: EscU/YscU/HrcU family type III secretion system export apparatus switch protein [Parashewanella sp.]